MSVLRSLSDIVRLRAWYMAFAGPVEIWYFSIFYLSLVTGFSNSIVKVLMLVASLMLYEAWGVLLNDIFDREVDESAGKSGRVRGHNLSLRLMTAVMLFAAGLDWLLIISSRGTWLFYSVWVFAYLLGILYSTPPLRFKNRGILSFFSNSLLERPLPVVIVFLFFRYYGLEIIAFPILSELIWSVFKHQVHDYDEDSKANVRTFAVIIGRDRSYKIVRLVVNPLSVVSVLFFATISVFVFPQYALIFLISIAIIVVGIGVMIYLERASKVHTSQIDPPYILFLNLAFLLTVLLAIAVIALVNRPSYIALVLLYLISLVPYLMYYRPLIIRTIRVLMRH